MGENLNSHNYSCLWLCCAYNIFTNVAILLLHQNMCLGPIYVMPQTLKYSCIVWLTLIFFFFFISQIKPVSFFFLFFFNLNQNILRMKNLDIGNELDNIVSIWQFLITNQINTLNVKSRHWQWTWQYLINLTTSSQIGPLDNPNIQRLKSPCHCLQTLPYNCVFDAFWTPIWPNEIHQFLPNKKTSDNNNI